MRILHVIDSLDAGGSAQQVRLLAPTLAGDGCTVDVCCLGSGGPIVEELRRGGVAVHVLGWTRWLDAAALWELRRLVRTGGHDVIHVWRLAALRVVAMVARESLPRIVVSSPLPSHGQLTWWDRWVLRRVKCVALAGEAERQRCMQDGLSDVRWQGVPAAVALDRRSASAVAWATRYPRRIACAGRLERGRGFREAIWAVDILGQIFPDLHLLIAGAGPRRPALQEMIDRLAIRNAHFLGDSIVTANLLAAADVCWVPTRIDRGRRAALEAMAMGRAVVASDVPCLRELIRDGETGYLVTPGDPVAIARRTRALLRDPKLCARVGCAAQEEVQARFGLPRVATRWHCLYNDLAA